MADKQKIAQKNNSAQLLGWYKANCRPLPWRESRDAYRIWISEVMLQQTTVAAVLPYYERFLKRFPTVDALAEAKLPDVLELWSGLGYYSRARNLHATAQVIAATGFPKTAAGLLNLKGFGPYMSRAVASFAFDEACGVLDGNVIRFLSRFHREKVESWKPSGRAVLQAYADRWVQPHDSRRSESHLLNQALIEIGATICLSRSPQCLLCPVMKQCQSVGTSKIESLPLKKPKRETEIWVWKPQLLKKAFKNSKKLALTLDHDTPFLKNHWAWPGTAKLVKSPPKTFDFKHAVTHHSIYVQVEKGSTKLKSTKLRSIKLKWCSPQEIKKIAPTSLVNKVLLFTDLD